MDSIRNELLRLVASNEAEQWVPTDTALHELRRFGDRLIPGLIACLSDRDADVRQLAIEMLGEARAASAVPALIELLKNDGRFIQIHAIYTLAEIGPPAITSVPWLEPWLFEDSEYLRVLVAGAILRIDPTRNELNSLIRAATKSDDAATRGLAKDFFDEHGR